MSKKLFFLLLAVFFTLIVNAQKASSQFESTYNSTKQLLDQGKYGLAMQSFKSLLLKGETNELVPYAKFYLGNSAYQNGDKEYAKNVFLDLTVKHPNWDEIDAAYLWLSRIGFEQSGVFKGMLYADQVSSNPYLTKSNIFVKTHIQDQPLDVLEQLYANYPKNREIAEAYAIELSKLPKDEQPDMLLKYLIEEYDIDSEKINSIPESVYKEQYTIGIMLPLFINRVEATGKYLKKSLAVDIYEGAIMAAYDTDSALFKVEVFDTKKDSGQVSLSYKSGGLENLDAILGPIYPNPIERMKVIAREEKINFLNPTSSNSSISNDSPYSFLSRATATQLAQAAAAYISNQQISKTVIIYYGTSEVDSIAAFVYKNELELDSFKIISINKIGSENRRDVYDGLTASKQIIDRRRTRRMTKEEIRNSFNLPTIDSLLIQPDSIGHLFIASSEPTISTEAMSAIISRGDSIKIMGVGNWFESKNAGLGIMERLEVTLAISALDDVSTLEYKQLTSRYIKKYRTHPSKYFFRGYFGMKAITESLKKYGTYFQNEYHKQGNFNSLYAYEHSNSNASIKIIKLVENSIQVQNIDKED